MTKDEQFIALREFAHRVIASVAEGSDVSESDVDEWALEFGLIEQAEQRDEFVLSTWMRAP
jgi:hypothetical protein